MTPQERKKAAADLAGILARGFDLHIDAHGPDGSYAVRTEDGRRYQVAGELTEDGYEATSWVVRGGELFALTVRPCNITEDLVRLALLNPGLSVPELRHLQAQAQILDEDDARTGYREPGEDDD